jgi:hypothetical protein
MRGKSSIFYHFLPYFTTWYGSAEPDPEPKEIFTDLTHFKANKILGPSISGLKQRRVTVPGLYLRKTHGGL